MKSYLAKYGYQIHLRKGTDPSQVYDAFEFPTYPSATCPNFRNLSFDTDTQQLVMEGAVIGATKQSVKGKLSEVKAELKRIFNAQKISLVYEIYGEKEI